MAQLVSFSIRNEVFVDVPDNVGLELLELVFLHVVDEPLQALGKRGKFRGRGFQRNIVVEIGGEDGLKVMSYHCRMLERSRESFLDFGDIPCSGKVEPV